MEPQIRFCTSADGTRIAYATMGEGPPLLFVPGWVANIELEWKHPGARVFYESMGRGRLLTTYINRGVGGAQQVIDDLSLEARMADVGALADHLELERFDVIGTYDGACQAVGYAAQHPERVSRLVLWAPYARGEDVAKPEASRSLVQLMRGNWSLARRAMAGMAFPSGTIELQRWWSDVVRQSVSPEVAARYWESIVSIDVTSQLPQLKAPTLVLHQSRDRLVPIDVGRAAAALIPDVRFVSIDGDVGHPLFAVTPHVETIAEFLDEDRIAEPSAAALATGDVHTILMTDMEGSTTLTQQLGDARAQEVLRTHNSIIRDALKAHSGSETKHTGDGIMASFASASKALEAAISMQRAFAQHNDSDPDTPIRVRIGLNAGEPVAEDADLFGTAVQLAARICAHAEPGQILIPEGLRHLVAGKKFLFADLGETVLRGFEDPVRLYELRWQGED